VPVLTEVASVTEVAPAATETGVPLNARVTPVPLRPLIVPVTLKVCTGVLPPPPPPPHAVSATAISIHARSLFITATPPFRNLIASTTIRAQGRWRGRLNRR
jgi:hypothetical protein